MDLLTREQIKYVFRPPRYRAALIPLLVRLSDRFFLRGKFNVQRVEVRGAEEVAKLCAQGHSVLVAPNHADHADPHTMAHVGRRYGLPFHFMAAREVFEEQGAFGSWALQRMGAFSVDREGADVAAIKMAITLLKEGRHPLVIFPEGQIYHHHERLAPLNEGVATILLRSTKGQEEKESYLVPTALRYAYDEGVVNTYSTRLSRLEERITWKPRERSDPVDRIYRLGSGLLAIKEVEFLGTSRPGDLVERIIGLQHALVGRIESAHYGEEREGSIPERVKALRSTIRRELTDESPEGTNPPREEELYDDLDTLFVAVQLYSYPGQYLKESPTLHRIAETLVKLEEDVLGEGLYPTPRSVTVRFGEPVRVGGFLEQHGLTVKSAVAPLTELLADGIQSMLEELASEDPGPS